MMLMSRRSESALEDQLIAALDTIERQRGGLAQLNRKVQEQQNMLALALGGRPSAPRLQGVGWWTLAGEDFLAALRAVADGELPDIVYAEMYANSEHQQPGEDGSDD
jgi:hypothetical protein